MPKAGIVTVVGKPNAGKSTLLNRIVGEKLSIVSPKPQSTRDRIVGIHTTDDAQMILLDTPGLLNPRYPLQQSMRGTALAALNDADVVLYLVDGTEGPPQPLVDVAQLDRRSARRSSSRSTRSTCSTAASASALRERASRRACSSRRRPATASMRCSRAVGALLPESPFLYPEDEISTQTVRFFVERARSRNGARAARRRSAVQRRVRDRGVPRIAVACVHSCGPPRRARQPEANPHRRRRPARSRHRPRRAQQDRSVRRFAACTSISGSRCFRTGDATPHALHRFGYNTSRGSIVMTVSPQLLAILVCPKCKGRARVSRGGVSAGLPHLPAALRRFATGFPSCSSMRRRRSSALRTLAGVAILLATRRTVSRTNRDHRGLEGGQELLLPTGARGLGMAQAIVAGGIGAEAILRNPALIAHGPREVAFNIAQQANGITVADVTTAIVWPVPRVGSVRAERSIPQPGRPASSQRPTGRRRIIQFTVSWSAARSRLSSAIGSPLV